MKYVILSIIAMAVLQSCSNPTEAEKYAAENTYTLRVYVACDADVSFKPYGAMRSTVARVARGNFREYKTTLHPNATINDLAVKVAVLRGANRDTIYSGWVYLHLATRLDVACP